MKNITTIKKLSAMPYAQAHIEIDGDGKNANDYSVGYMWGTVGLIYNPKYINDDEAKSWDVLRNPAYNGKVLLKDAFRDVYTAFLIALNK